MCYQAPTLIAAILRQLSLSILFILIASCHRDEEPVAARHSGEEPITARRLYMRAYAQLAAFAACLRWV